MANDAAHPIGRLVRKNTPLCLVLVGILEVSPNCPKCKQLAEVNGASMLFGAAREIIRFTSRGPYLEIIIPSVSFYQKREARAAVPDGSVADRSR
jgi:hypothetical protein